MEYYFSELSVPTASDSHEIVQQIRHFVLTCKGLEEIQFKTFRSSGNIRNIEINGKLLIEWLSNEVDIRRRLKGLISKFPYIEEQDFEQENIQSRLVYYKGDDGFGLRAAHLKKSLIVSFPSNDNWKKTETEAQHEYLPESSDKTITENIIVKNASLPEHCEIHKPFAIEKLKQDEAPEDWEPDIKYLKRVDISNKLLNIEEFYNKKGTPTVAECLEIGKEVAELNFYEKNEALTKLNTTKYKIRHIYQSKNTSGKKRYLSIDVEKGAFEVCDESGTHQEEILFNEEHSGSQKLDHSIKLKK